MRLIDAESIRYDGALFPLRRDGKIESLIPMYAVTRMFIDKMPTVDAAPVKHGEWIHGREVSRDYVGDACVCIRYEKWWCSECNYTVDFDEPLWHYCPNCGAKMDGGKG